MKVELFYVHDCPNAMDYLPELEALLLSVGIDDPVRLRLIESHDQAVAERFLGSPTVRIDGTDVDPTAGDRIEYAVVCRLYPSPTGTSGRPPPDWVRSAAARALERLRHHRHRRSGWPVRAASTAPRMARESASEPLPVKTTSSSKGLVDRSRPEAPAALP